MAWLASWSKLAPCLVALVFLTKVDAKNKTVTYGTKCADDQFDCGYQDKGIRKCIPLEWQCDNIVDCENSQKDEFNCRYIHNCKPGFLACRDGDCVEGEFKCNGFDDCGDGSDERGCNGVSHLADPGSAPISSDLEQCSEGWFRCTRGPCIQNEAKCDGIDDCPEKDDESDCSSVKEARGKSCLGHQFKCVDNDVCIPLSWKCNGNKDCIDGSDEAKCKEADQDLESLPSREEYHELTLNNNICPANQFLCEPGNCIPKEKLCDGTKDCSNGNDEGGRCGDCSGYGCTYKCIDSPDGPTCWCVEGEELAADGRTCVDINECDSHKGLVCSHRCINTEGSFECSCVDGYELAEDAHTCTAQPDPWASVLFSLGSEVRHMTPSKSGSMRDYGVSQHNELVGTVVRSLTFAPRTNELLMAISDVDDQGSIHTSVNGVQKCLLSNMIGVANIAFDWVTSNIYYTAQRPSELTGVGVCDLKGRFCKLLVKGSVSTEYYRRQVYRGLVVNPNHATMYWMDIPGNFDNPKIMMSDMDGANVKMLLTSKLEHPQGLAMDYIRQHLYYADIELQLIERIDVRTRDRMTVVTRGLHHPYELAFFDNHLYWTDWGTEAVLSYNVNSDDTPHVVHSLEHMPYGITINHTLYWNTSMVDPCNDLDCDHLCVLSRTMKDEIVGRCLCPNFYREDPNQGCIPLNWTELENSNLTRTAPALCPSLMAERCEKNMGCMNLAECHVSNSEGKVRSVKCRCETGYSGLYCELGDGFYATKMDVGIGAWLPISIFLVLVIMLAVLVYFSSEKCPFIRDMGDALMPLVHRIHPREDKQHIVTPKSMSFESDSFENPSYGKGHDQDHHQCTPLSNGGSPTYNTLPEPAPIIKEDPKSTKGFDIRRQP